MTFKSTVSNAYSACPMIDIMTLYLMKTIMYSSTIAYSSLYNFEANKINI